MHKYHPNIVSQLILLKNLLNISLFFLCLLFSSHLQGQDSIRNTDDIYGLDPVLHNGKQYLYYPPPGTAGHQYFASATYPSGSLWIRGQQYDNQRLNYDIYHQQLILFYKNTDGSGKTIVVSDAWLEKFTLGNYNFMTFSGKDTVTQIYQYLGESPVKILYKWRKDWILEPSMGASLYIFTRPAKEKFILKDHILSAYNSNRSFIQIFSPAQQPQIKKYMRQHRIKVKKADDAKMTGFIEFINKNFWE